MQTTVADIDESGQVEPIDPPDAPVGDTGNCSDASQLSDAEIADCINGLLDELVARGATE